MSWILPPKHNFPWSAKSLPPGGGKPLTGGQYFALILLPFGVEVLIFVMGTKKGKICPQCGASNNEYAIYCTNPRCRGTLMNVDPVEVEDAPPPPAWNKGPEGGKKAGGEVGEDITTRPLIRPTEVLTTRPARLEYIGSPAYEFKVQDGDTVGRAGDVNVSALERSRYISGQHASFHLNRGVWYLKSLSQTNKTYLNGEEVPRGSSRELADGDVITMANTNFTFRVSH